LCVTLSVGDKDSSVPVVDNVAEENFMFPFSQDTTVSDLITTRGNCLAYFMNQPLANSKLLSTLVVSDGSKVVLKPFHVWLKIGECCKMEFTNRDTKLGAFLQQRFETNCWAYFQGNIWKTDSTTMAEFFTTPDSPLQLKRNEIMVQMEGHSIDIIPLKSNFSVHHVVLEYCKNQKIKCRFDKIKVEFDNEDVQLSELVVNLKSRMADTDILFLYQYKEPKPPILTSAASSQSTQDDVVNLRKHLPLYSNWLSLEIYDDLEGASIDENIVKNFQMLMVNFKIDEKARLRGYEKTYTALLSRFLDHFLFGKDKIGCCLHQIAIADTSGESPDFYVAKTNDLGVPVAAVLFADYNKGDEYERAFNQSVRYTIKVLSGKFCTFLSLPCSSKKVSLQLHVTLDNEVGVITICEAAVSNNKELGRLLYALYKGVHNFIKNFQFMTKELPIIEPIKGLEFQTVKSYGKSDVLSFQEPYRVFRKNGFVYKFFDTHLKQPNSHKDNYETIKKLGDHYLPEMSIRNLSNDGRFKVLQYQYMEEKKKDDIKAADFKPLIVSLDRLHKEDTVHGDIRRPNLLFPKDGDAKIIDFDLAAKEGELYVQGYNHKGIGERHPDAQQGSPMKKIHDRYAMAMVLKSFNRNHCAIEMLKNEFCQLSDIAKTLV